MAFIFLLMSPEYTYLLFFAVLFLIMLLYFKIAAHLNIVDKPNSRSSHTLVTVRGGGIIFPIACLFYFISFGFSYPWFFGGLLLIATISFLDDIYTLNSKIRMLFHFSAIMMLALSIHLFDFVPLYMFPLILVFAVGTINAYNFMDGINGITGSYSLLILISLFYINSYVITFTQSSFLIVIGLAVLVFNFFNFRAKAKCFAGDVGSVSIAFIILFFIGQLILKTNNFSYILLLLLYGLDAVTTIIFRVFRRENIMEPHRSHFYQYLANERKWSHLLVSALYLGIQVMINLMLVFYIQKSLMLAVSFALLVAALFVGIRFWLEGSDRLLKAL